MIFIRTLLLCLGTLICTEEITFGADKADTKSESGSSDLPQAIMVAAITIGLTILATRYTDRESNREERLMDLYSEFVGIAWSDLERADAADVAMNHYDNNAAMAATLEQNRLPNRSAMLRLACQISLLESSQQLRELVAQLGGCQAFMPYWWIHNQSVEMRQEFRERYNNERREFRNRLRELIQLVATTHRFRGSLSGFPTPG